MTAQPLTLTLNTDQTLIAREVPSQRVLEITLQAPLSSSQDARPQLNLALVLDRSGSMSGDKLAYVKEAALHVLNLLQEQDRVALVVFDDQVKLLAPSLSVTSANRDELAARIRSVREGGQTNLSGGWLSGCQEAATCAGPGTLNRVLLLTDGLANEGITDQEELARHARELASRGVSTSTFGVGDGFNEHLLEAMSNQGSGTFYYIQTPNQIPKVFAREFKELAAVTARETHVTISIPPQVSAMVLGGWRYENTKADTAKTGLRIFLGSLYAGRTQEIYLRVLTPPSAGLDALAISARASALNEAGQAMLSQANLIFTYAPASECETAPHQAAVLQRFAGVDLANTASEALKLERSGNRNEAAHKLKLSLEANRPHLDPRHADLYEGMAERMLNGMDEKDRKSSHQSAYSQKRRREA